MRIKKPRVATLDEVRISRDGETAIIEFLDTSIGTTNLKLGESVNHMTDDEILECFNDTIRAMKQMAADYEHVAEEVPVGSPQIKYFAPGDQWVPRGDVLRCSIDDLDGEALIHIDDVELSPDQFSRLLTTHSGWGMRVIFVPEDETDQPARVVVREPTNDV